jgi:nucleotide-binding universal stress UspA family protein
MPMYKHILIPLENSCADNTILKHIRPLAKLTSASITIVHVADGFMARNQKDLGESQEMRDDYRYLKHCELELKNEGFEVNAVLLFGEPYKEILALAEKEQCDLIAMAAHGHRGISDIILGSVTSEVRHRTKIPVLIIQA